MEIKLDKTKVYDLSGLSPKQKNEIEKITNIKLYGYRYLLYSEGWYVVSEGTVFTTVPYNTRELFYILHKVQVDCTDLSEEQINKMKEVVIQNGYSLLEYKNSFKIFGTYHYFRAKNKNICEFGIYEDAEPYGYTTITYEKFIELFDCVKSEEDISRYGARGLIGKDLENGWESYKKESSEEHNQKAKETLRFLTEKGIFLTPEQYKLLWE